MRALQFLEPSAPSNGHVALSQDACPSLSHRMRLLKSGDVDAAGAVRDRNRRPVFGNRHVIRGLVQGNCAQRFRVTQVPESYRAAGLSDDEAAAILGGGESLA